MKKAFTLIELLVVVLIIGILSSIALPQYQKAVEKARFTTYQTLGGSLAQAVRIAYLDDNTWPTSWDQLVVSLPGDMNTQTANNVGICRKNSKMFCCITFPNSAGVAGAVRCGDNSYHLAYVRSYALQNGTPASSMGAACIAKEEKYKSICKSISGVSTPTTTSTYTPDGWKSGYFYYTSIGLH